MSNRLNDAMKGDGSRNSMGRVPGTPAGKRHSGLDPSTVNAMFPDAAAAIASEKAKYTKQTGNQPSSNRNSAVYDNRASLTAPGISGLVDDHGPVPGSPWGSRSNDQASRPKSATGPSPMGQFMQPPPSAGGLRSPAPPQIMGNSNLQSTTINAPDNQGMDMPLVSPYAPQGGSWASMVNTPMVSNFNLGHTSAQSDMIANATAMKLAALSTHNNRVALDDNVRKYRRARSNDGQGPMSPGFQNNMQNNMPGANVVMINEHGQVLTRDQVIALQAQQNAFGNRSRPSSPGLAMQGGFGQMQFTSPQNNGFLTAYDGTSPMMNNSLGMGSLNIGQYGMNGQDVYLSDHGEMRGRSPRGRRGSSKPPEDPTDPSLLQDIPSWLRSLRLHKYTDNLKDMNWTELVELDEAALEARGVNALGARRKMLKVFEQVKGIISITFMHDSIANYFSEAKAEGKLA